MTHALLLAHQGGWDELVFVLAPLLVFAGLLLVAKRRVDRGETGQQGESGDVLTETATPATKPEPGDS